MCVKAVDFIAQVLDSPELEAVKDAVQNLQDIGESLTERCTSSLLNVLVSSHCLCRSAGQDGNADAFRRTRGLYAV